MKKKLQRILGEVGNETYHLWVSEGREKYDEARPYVTIDKETFVCRYIMNNYHEWRVQQKDENPPTQRA